MIGLIEFIDQKTFEKWSPQSEIVSKKIDVFYFGMYTS